MVAALFSADRETASLFEQVAEEGGVTITPVLFLFQALSPADMDSWKAAFDRAEASEMLSPATGGDAGISVPVHLMPVRLAHALES